MEAVGYAISHLQGFSSTHVFSTDIGAVQRDFISANFRPEHIYPSVQDRPLHIPDMDISLYIYIYICCGPAVSGLRCLRKEEGLDGPEKLALPLVRCLH